MLKGIVRQRLGGSKSASSVKNAPLGSAEVRAKEVGWMIIMDSIID